MRGTTEQQLSIVAVEGREQEQQQQQQLLQDFIKELCFWGDLTTEESQQPQQQQQEPRRRQEQRGRRPHRIEHRRDSSNRTGKPVWRTAVDAGSGRTYYYDALTRRTQWDKVRRTYRNDEQLLHTVELDFPDTWYLPSACQYLILASRNSRNGTQAQTR